MTRAKRFRDRLLQQEGLNFLLTNRVPRVALTIAMGWFSKLRQPLVHKLSMAVWRACTDVDLSDARKTRFDSLHDCFTRELRAGARPVDARPGVLCSPCDAIVGAHGQVRGTRVFQAKGLAYSLADLFGDAEAAQAYRGGGYVTLRLTSAMYHRFHAPHDCHVQRVDYISGDTWNVNPIALKRVERLFCRNERAVIHAHLQAGGQPVALVAVAAILVASIRLHFADVLLHLRYRGAPRIACDARLHKGQEMGWFEHGSTILLFTPPGWVLCQGIDSGQTVRMGQALLQMPAAAAVTPPSSCERTLAPQSE